MRPVILTMRGQAATNSAWNAYDRAMEANMLRPSSLALAAALALCSTLAFAGDRTWHRNLEAGVAAARGSGKPILVVTAWKSGI